MDVDNHFVITINRQFGTGGHEIGRRLAKRLNVRFVDKEILYAAAKILEIDKMTAEKLSNTRPSWWNDLFSFNAVNNNTIPIEGYNRTEPTTRSLFYAQADIIRLIADMEPCVIIGRCGFDILKDRPNTLKLFVHNTDENRQRCIMERDKMNEKDAKAAIRKIDKLRASYTKTFTGKNWWDLRNYDMSISAANLGIDKTVNRIIEIAPDFIDIE